MTDEEERPGGPLRALVPFGLGAAAAAAACVAVTALPEPVRHAARTAGPPAARPGPLTPPVVRIPGDGTDVRVTVLRGRVRVENVSGAQTGRLRLEFRPARRDTRPPADCGACVWPRGLDPGRALTVTLRRESGDLRVRAVTEVPDRAPGDNEARTP